MYRIFLSTLSLRRATPSDEALSGRFNISIHALLAESDPGRAPLSRVIVISIHALLAESDTASLQSLQDEIEFLSTLSLRRATGYG